MTGRSRAGGHQHKLEQTHTDTCRCTCKDTCKGTLINRTISSSAFRAVCKDVYNVTYKDTYKVTCKGYKDTSRIRNYRVGNTRRYRYWWALTTVYTVRMYVCA